MAKPFHVLLNSVLFTILSVVFFVVTCLAFIIQSIVKGLVPKGYRYQKALTDEVCVVTGGGGGLGRLLAVRLAKLKAIVVLWDINFEGAKETAKLIESLGGKAYAYKCDLSNREDIYRVAALTQNDVGQVSILINNAGVASGKLFMDTPDFMIQKTFEVNVLAHFWTTKAFLPSMVKNDHGHIVTIASMAGYVGMAKLVDYCSSKFAAIGFDEALRLELETQGIKGVKTTVICPFFLQATGMFDSVNALIPSLKTNEVVDAAIEAIRQNDKLILLPAYFKHLLIFRWIMPWKVISLFLRAIVRDAVPNHNNPSPVQITQQEQQQQSTVPVLEKCSTREVTLPNGNHKT